jgi:hypothetical protein
MRIVIALLMICSISFAQEKFTYDIKGLTDYLVKDNSMAAADVYKKTINWIKENYVNPDEVIKMTIENEKIRFEGVKSNLTCIGSVCSDATYMIEVSIKDGKYKFDPVYLKLSVASGKFFEVPLSNFSIYYDKSGQVKNQSIQALDSFALLFKDLSQSLDDYINGKRSEEVV